MAQRFTDNPDGTVNVDITCDVCGGPITHSNEYGMFCDKECQLEDSKKAYEKVHPLIGALTDLLFGKR